MINGRRQYQDPNSRLSRTIWAVSRPPWATRPDSRVDHRIESIRTPHVWTLAPEVSPFAEIFAELLGELGRTFQRRQKVLPGITDLAQIGLDYDADLVEVEHTVAKDLEHIAQRRATS